MTQHPVCEAYRARAAHVLAGGPATLSKHPSRYPIPIAPSVLVRGEGAHVWCADQIEYIDTVAALGPVICGHSNPSVNLAVMEQMDRLASSTLSTPLETDVAEMLCELIPGAEQVRYAVSGKDVTEAAIKLARYITGHRHILYCGYHGGFSDYLITTDKTGGLLPNLATWNHQVPWRDFDAIEQLLYGDTPLAFHDDLAAIILEVPPEYPGVPIEGTTAILERYKGIAREHGALFILDEIVTGLRYGMGGAQVYYGVEADLVTMSKALGNGVPIAAIMGGRDLMQEFQGGHVFLSTTFGGNPLGLAAAKATLEELQSRTHGWCVLHAQGQALYDGLSACITQYDMPVRLKGNFARMVLEWKSVPDIATAAELHTLWLQETVKHGVLFGVPLFPMCAYTADTVKQILAAAENAMDTIRFALDHAAMTGALDVPLIGAVFERYAMQAQKP